MEILILDSPLVEQLRVLRVLDADDVGALSALSTVGETCYVGVRTVHLLFDVQVRHREARPEWKVSEHLDVVATAFEWRPRHVLGGQRRGYGERENEEEQTLQRHENLRFAWNSRPYIRTESEN